VGVEDFSGATEAICFAEPYEAHRVLINSDAVLCFAGRTSSRENEDTRLMLEKVLPLDEACRRLARQVRIRLTPDLPEPTVDSVLALVAAHPGPCPLIIELCDGGFQTRLRARRASVAPNAALLGGLAEVLGPEAVVANFLPAASLVDSSARSRRRRGAVEHAGG
jgi:DNA polymerase III alpha subunit